MAHYAIGDVHGCYAELRHLLHEIGWKQGEDRLWLVGDLINRGPSSLDVVRFVQDLGDRAVAIQGNHEVRAVQGLFGSPSPVFQEHMGYLLDAPDCAALAGWLRRLPFLARDEEHGLTMVHAGLHPHWDVNAAMARAATLETSFRDDHGLQDLLAGMTGPQPEKEPDPPLARQLWDLAVFTRIRLCTPEGQLLWPRSVRKEINPYLPPPEDSPYRSWHDIHQIGDGELLLYGHWAAAGLTVRPRTLGLDGGCVYGGQLVAVRLDHPDRPITTIPTPQYVAPDGE